MEKVLLLILVIREASPQKYTNQDLNKTKTYI